MIVSLAMSAKLFNILQYSLGGALIAFSVALVIVVLLQSAKDRRLSGTIAGGAETFFGKTKGKSADKVLSKITIVISVLVVLITLALNIIIAYNASLG